MEFALINNNSARAFPKGRAVCPICSKGVLAKCGEIVVDHWAHEANVDCDHWYETETPWHRKWKAFGHRTEVTIGPHRADIVTSAGLIVELQHSPISVPEILERERFYGSKLRWLFDGTDLVVSDEDNDYWYGDNCLRSDDICAFRYKQDCRNCRHYGYGADCHKIHGIDVPTATLELRYKRHELNTDWYMVTFRWKRARVSYGYCQNTVYIDLPNQLGVMKLGKLYIDDGAPYGGWGWIIPRDTVEGWLR